MKVNPSNNHIVFIALGSNLGDKKENLEKAIREIAETAGVVSAISSVYETEPWEFVSPNSFLNMVIRIETSLTPVQLLRLTQKTERKIGRTSKTTDSYHDRLIDIDLILYDDLILASPGLTLPHPHLHERLFVLEPLCEIAPEVLHPVLKKSMRELLLRLHS